MCSVAHGEPGTLINAIDRASWLRLLRTLVDFFKLAQSPLGNSISPTLFCGSYRLLLPLKLLLLPRPLLQLISPRLFRFNLALDLVPLAHPGNVCL